MKRTTVCSVLTALLLTVTILAVTPVWANQIDYAQLAESAELVYTKSAGDLEVKLLKVDDQFESLFGFFKSVDLVEQYVGRDIDTPAQDKSFTVGEPFNMVMWINVKRAGNIAGLFLWFGDQVIIWAEGVNDLWWEFGIPEPGVYILFLSLPSTPYIPGCYFFMGAVKGIWPLFGLDIGFWNPGPFGFCIVEP